MSSRRASPALIGAFVVGGLALLAGLLIALAGGDLFQRRERAVMYFDNSIYGLEVGAPVVFRGVRVGNVKAIGIFHDTQTDAYAIPVVAELEGDALRGLDGRHAGAQGTLAALVERGLRARLQMQSLLTGQLYVDLDLRPEQVGTLRGARPGTVEIPTTKTAIQTLMSQLEGVDFRRMVDDVATIANSARTLIGGPELRQALADLQQTTRHLRQLSERADGRFDALAGEVQSTLAGTRGAVERLGRAADGVNGAAERLGNASQQAQALLAPDSALVTDLRATADQLAQAAAAVRRGTADDAPLVRGTERALDDVSHAARALRELAELLERRPDALLRGRPQEQE